MAEAKLDVKITLGVSEDSATACMNILNIYLKETHQRASILLKDAETFPYVELSIGPQKYTKKEE